VTGQRRSIRHPEHDYSQSGAYFVTIVVKDFCSLFGNIIEEKMNCNDAGEMIIVQWNNVPDRFENTQLDEFVVMPNHFHGIVLLGMIQVRDEWIRQETKNPTLA
jgi:REP-associated tyrosine transposase